MSKLRVYELAEKIGLSSDQLIARLKRLGIEVGSNLATVDEAIAQSLLNASEKLRESATKEAAKEAARERSRQISKKKVRTAPATGTRKQLRKARAEKARLYTEEYEKREADELARRREERRRAEEEKARLRQEEEERQRAALEEKRRLEAEAALKRQAEEEARKAEHEAARKRAAEEAARRQLEAEEAAARDRAAEESAREASRRAEAETRTETTAPAAPSRPAWEPHRPRPARPVRPAARKGKTKRGRAAAAVAAAAPAPVIPVGPPRKVALTEGVTVKELSEKMEVKARDLMALLIRKGVMVSINTPLEFERAKEVAREFNFEAEIISFEEEVQRHSQRRPEVVGDNLQPRPPVVTIMGHVDHGKTSLLDAIRESNIIAGEAGGITQHIGAYHVEVNGRSVTFLDTPGHEAFTLMRSRGAQATDIVVLVVAADDGVMPQTREAVDHARAAGVPMIVALNKMDKPEAKPDVVKKQLADLGLVPEEWGGQTVFAPVSAKKRTGLEAMLEMILLVADLAELKADPGTPASGVVLEAKLDRARGAVASVLIQNGTLRVGDPFLAGLVSGKVRAMFDENGVRVTSAGPSLPVEVTGLDGVPLAGDSFQVMEEERQARMMGALRQSRRREEDMKRAARPRLEGLFQQIEEGKIKELPIILRCDVQGSAEVLQKSIQDLSTDKVKVRILHAGIGAITETDVLLASSSGAIVIGFHVRPERGARDLAEKEEVEIRLYDVIYTVTQEIRAAMVGLLEPTLREEVLGRAEVRETFKVPKAGTVAGCYIVEGRVPFGSEVRLLRDNTVVYQGRIASLRRFKEDASEVRQGYECGIGLERFQDVKQGDVIEVYKVEKVAPQTL